jgi:hypothetical protein
LKSGYFSAQFYLYANGQFRLDDMEARVPHSSWHHGLNPDYVSNNYLTQPDTGLSLACRINKDGFRDKEFEYHPDEFRVFFLGDSYTEGYYLDQEDAIPQRSEVLLRERGINGGSVRTFNFGCGSYSPLLCYRVLRCYVDRFHPNMVIYLMNWGDPFDDAYYGYVNCFEYDTNGLPLWMKKQLVRTRDLGPHPGLKINSYLFLAGAQCLEILRSEWSHGQAGDDRDGLTEWPTIRAKQVWYALEPAARPDVLRAIYTEAFKPILGMRQLAQAAGADFKVVYICAPWEASSLETPSFFIPEAIRLLPRIRPLMEGKGYYESGSEPVLAEVAKQYGVELYIPLDALREKARSGRLYFVSDSHLNKDGADFYANLCATIVAERASGQVACATAVD